VQRSAGDRAGHPFGTVSSEPPREDTLRFGTAGPPAAGAAGPQAGRPPQSSSAFDEPMMLVQWRARTPLHAVWEALGNFVHRVRSLLSRFRRRPHWADL
jgi:hypothetical protein